MKKRFRSSRSTNLNMSWRPNIKSSDYQQIHISYGQAKRKLNKIVTYLVDWIQDVLGKSTNVSFLAFLFPFILLGIVELVTPQPLHQPVRLDLEFIRVHFRKLLEGESPAMKTRSEANCTLGWIHHHLTHWSAILTICRDDDVYVFHCTLERLVEFLRGQLESEECQVHLVHEQDRLDSLGNCLTEYSLSLDTDTC